MWTAGRPVQYPHSFANEATETIIVQKIQINAIKDNENYSSALYRNK